MKKFFILTKVLLKSGFGNMTYDDGNGRKKGRFKKSLIYIFLGICMIPFAGMLGYMGYSGYRMLEGLNTDIIIGMACIAGVFMSFFSGMTMCVGIFFNSSDTEFLLPMPLKAEHIVGAKFTTMYFYTFLTDLLFVMPILTGYGIAGGCGALYWIMAALVTVILPVTPLIYGSLISMVLIRVFKRARNKDFLTVISTIFALIMVIVINVFTQSFGNSDDVEIAKMLMTKGKSLLRIMSTVFPNTLLAERAVSERSPLMLILFLASAAAFVVLFIFVARGVYIKSVVEMSQTKSKSRSLSSVEMERAVRKNSKLKAYVVKELKLAFRTPIYFMNCIMLSALWPVIFLIPMIVGAFNDNGETAVSEGEMSFSQLIEAYPELLAGLCMMVVFGLTVLAVSFSMLNNTAISREGKNVFFMKYIPMSYEKQLLAKILPGIILTLVTGTLYSIIGMAAAILAFDFDIPLGAAAMSVIISVCACISFNFLQIMTDIIKPKLDWQTEQAAVKQNIVAIVPMFVILISGVLICLGGFKLCASAGISVYAVGGIAIGLLALLGAIFYKIDLCLAKKYFPKY